MYLKQQQNPLLFFASSSKGLVCWSCSISYPSGVFDHAKTSMNSLQIVAPFTENVRQAFLRLFHYLFAWNSNVEKMSALNQPLAEASYSPVVHPPEWIAPSSNSQILLCNSINWTPFTAANAQLRYGRSIQSMYGSYISFLNSLLYADRIAVAEASANLFCVCLFFLQTWNLPKNGDMHKDQYVHSVNRSRGLGRCIPFSNP